jgi:hypothetical protein
MMRTEWTWCRMQELCIHSGEEQDGPTGSPARFRQPHTLIRLSIICYPLLHQPFGPLLALRPCAPPFHTPQQLPLHPA